MWFSSVRFGAFLSAPCPGVARCLLPAPGVHDVEDKEVVEESAHAGKEDGEVEVGGERPIDTTLVRGGIALLSPEDIGDEGAESVSDLTSEEDGVDLPAHGDRLRGQARHLFRDRERLPDPEEGEDGRAHHKRPDATAKEPVPGAREKPRG